MSDRVSPKLPRLPPLVPPRPAEPANRALAEYEERRRLAQRQSDHEFKVSDELAAMAAYAKKREDVDRDLAVGLAICARELGADDRMPATLQELVRQLPKSAKPTRKAMHEDARTGARGARATYLVLAITTLELLRELVPFARHLIGGP